MAKKRKRERLVWIDLEMTGLNPAADVILEIATIITDNELNIIAQGPDLVIYQPEEKLALMDEWVKKTHTKSGLLQEVERSFILQDEAGEETLSFIKEHCEKDEGVLAGNSVWNDANFLKAGMPYISEYLNYRIVDISSVKELIKRWYPNNPLTEFKKPENHRASEDIKASINELIHYRQHFFIKPTDLL